MRLKGGDPLIFGRGGEEAEAVRAAGIPVEIVPGVTAAQAAAAATGVCLTRRGLATGLRYVTGHCRADAPLDLDWAGLADPATTLVVYMGAANMAEIAARLMAHGMPGDMPVLAVAAATLPRERRLVSRLDAIARDAAEARARRAGPLHHRPGGRALPARARRTGSRRRSASGHRERPACVRPRSCCCSLAGPALRRRAAGRSARPSSRIWSSQDCGSCHGLTLAGGLGPDIRPAALAGRSPEALAAVILDGRPGTAMPPWRPLLTEAEAAWIAEYLLEEPRHDPRSSRCCSRSPCRPRPARSAPPAISGWWWSARAGRS